MEHKKLCGKVNVVGDRSKFSDVQYRITSPEAPEKSSVIQNTE